jgi:triosephosphate isomerase
MKARRSARYAIVNVCSLLLAAIFVFSGFTKAVDPVGGGIKIGSWLIAFGIDASKHETLLEGLSVLLSTAEFLLGVHLLLGMRRRLTSIATLLLSAFFTVLTFWLWKTESFGDCGCFGDAVHLTPGETLLKNIVLLAAAVVVAANPTKVFALLRYRYHWIAQSYALLFVLALSLYSYHYLPVVDYRPYHIGQDMVKASTVPPDAEAPVFQTVFTLEKNNVRKTFTLDNYPDSTWKFIDSETEMLKPGFQPEISDFAVSDDKGDDAAHALLHNGNYAFWIDVPRIENTDNGVIDAIADVFDYCRHYGYDIYGLTASDSSAVAEWLHHSGLSFTFFYADDVLLKTMVRSNPGVLLVRQGKILNKWSKNNIPNEDTLVAPLEKLSLICGKGSYGLKDTFKYIALFLIPLIIITFADKSRSMRKAVARRLHKRKRIITKNEMRKKIVAGNWKMNMNLQDGVALAKEINDVCKADKPNCDVVVCTPFIHLASVAAVLDCESVALGAENCADKEKGAYTGEVSAEMVKSTGAQYVILGHSERRQYYGETPEILKEKVLLALKNGLKVIFCCGETLEEREAGKENEVVKAELDGSVFNLSAEEWKNIVLAYEPIWAIGTGKTATSDQAEEMLAYIRSIVAEKYGKEVAEDTSILYGGSCKPSNAAELFGKADIDGGLIGGASLKVQDFKGIIDAWKK